MSSDPFAIHLIKKHARAAGVPENEILGIAKQETGYKGNDPSLVSPAGARGSLQVMPGTAKRYVSDQEYQTAEGQIKAGVLEYKRLREKYKDPQKAIRGYHGGEGAINNLNSYDRYANISTTDYTKNVMENAGLGEDDGDDPFALHLAKKQSQPSQAAQLINEIKGQQAKVVPSAKSAPRRSLDKEQAFEAAKASGDLETANRIGEELRATGYEVGSGAGFPYIKPPAIQYKAATKATTGKSQVNLPANDARMVQSYLKSVPERIAKRESDKRLTVRGKETFKRFDEAKAEQEKQAYGEYIVGLSNLNDEEKTTKAQSIAHDEKRDLTNEEREALGIPDIPVLTDLSTVIRGAGGAIGSKLKGLGRISDELPLPMSLGTNIVKAITGTNPITAAGEALKDTSDERERIYGRRGGLGEFEKSVGALIPELALRTPTSIGVSSGLSSYGEGASLPEAVGAGAKAAANVALGGKAVEMVPGMGNLPKVLQPVARYAGRAAANTAAPLAVDLATNTPIGEKEAVNALAFGALFGLLPHPVKEAATKSEAVVKPRGARPEAEIAASIKERLATGDDFTFTDLAPDEQAFLQQHAPREKVQRTPEEERAILEKIALNSPESIVEPAAPVPAELKAPESVPTKTDEAQPPKGLDIVSEGNQSVPVAKRLINERRAAERLAETDALTGIANRLALDKAIPSADADPNTSIVHFDVNDFGKVNKIVGLGEPAGDKELQRIASAIQQAAEENGVGGRVFRKGGDEFTVIAPKDKAEAVKARAEELVGSKTFEGTHGQTGQQVKADVSLSGSIGNTFKEAEASIQAAKGERKMQPLTFYSPIDEAGRQEYAKAIAASKDEGLNRIIETALDEGVNERHIEQIRESARKAGWSDGQTEAFVEALKERDSQLAREYPQQATREAPATRTGQTSQQEGDVAHHSQFQPRDNDGTFIPGKPEKPDAVRGRSLSKTLESAGYEKGSNSTYKPESISEGSERARQIVKEKGIDGAMEWVKNPENNGIEWASVGYEALNQSRAKEAELRASDPATADEIASRRLTFLDDFAAEATKKGQAIVGIKAIEEFAPDRAAYSAAKASKAGRGRGLSAEEEARITKQAEELSIANDRIKAQDKELEALKAKKGGSAKTPSKKTFQSSLDEQSKAALEALKPKLGKLEFGSLARKSERGAVKIGEPALEGDAELLAQYAAGRINKLNKLSDLDIELMQEFGKEIEPYLPDIHRRAHAIRQEARLKEIGESDAPRQKTILAEIQKEISQIKQAEREAAKQARQKEEAWQKAEHGELVKEVKAESKAETVLQRQERLKAERQRQQQSKEERRLQRETEIQERRLEAKANRERLAEAQREYREAAEAQRKAYRADIRNQRTAARKATAWDTPIRKEATEARARLMNADPKAPETLSDLASVAAEKFLPKEGSSVRGIGAVLPANFYSSLQKEFPNLVTKKNQYEVYKRAYARVQDMAAASREVARLRSASKESRRLWDELGIDEEAQAIMIRRAEAQRQQQAARQAMVQEFNYVSKSKAKRVMGELWSLPRALQSSIDAPLGRQGLFYLVTHPVQTLRYSVPATLKGYTSLRRGTFEQHVKDLQSHPDYELAKKAELSGSIFEGGSEEQFRSSWGDKLPHARLSEQAFNLGMDAQRLAVFSKYADYGRAEGYTFDSNPEFFKQAASLVNDATGRTASMGKWLDSAKPLLNTIFYSPRLQVSRVKLLNDLLNPKKYLSYDPAMRKIAAQEAVKAVVGFGLIYGTAAYVAYKNKDKVKMTFDPEDSDFGKVVIGNTRYDLSGGEAGLIRAAYRLIQAAGKQTRGEKIEYGKDAVTILGQWSRSKLAPVPGAAVNIFSRPAKGREGQILEGSDLVGKPANLDFKFGSKKDAMQTFQENQLIKLIVPMLTGDLTDAVVEDGWMGAVKTAPALTGIGTNTYKKKAKGKAVGATPRY